MLMMPALARLDCNGMPWLAPRADARDAGPKAADWNGIGLGMRLMLMMLA